MCVPVRFVARRVRARVQAMACSVEWRVRDVLGVTSVGIIEFGALRRHSSFLGYDNCLPVIGGSG